MSADPRPHLCEIAALIYERKLTDSAGGNMSVRQGARIYCTPRYAGSHHRWRIEPEQIVVTDMCGQKLEGRGELSREFEMHLAIYQAFPRAGGICHAHALNAMVFASMRRPIPPTSEQTMQYGTIPVAEEHPSHSPGLARAVVAALAPREADLQTHAIACLLAYHGITVAGRDLDDAYDALERLDGSCYILAARAAIEALDQGHK